MLSSYGYIGLKPDIVANGVVGLIQVQVNLLLRIIGSPFSNCVAILLMISSSNFAKPVNPAILPNNKMAISNFFVFIDMLNIDIKTRKTKMGGEAL